MANDRSPAARSFENEQSAAANRQDPLDGALEDTFPASDPISAASTSIPAGTTRRQVEVATTSGSPSVEDALQSILDHRNDPYAAPGDRMAALKGDADSLGHRAASDIRGRIRNNPWQAIGVAAAVGFVFGLTR
jgi:ElaB/YqjD/DUF883 family membrane-anchored ribosome-binding protein